jgi:hypothetical protein
MRIHYSLAAVAIAFALAGCNTQPIQNINQTAVVNAAGKPLTRDQVRGAIVRAGGALGWQMADEGPGKLVGTLSLRKHVAVVEIPYTASGYAIKYRSSVELHEANGQIHKNYNGWIQNLHRGITAQLSAS